MKRTLSTTILGLATLLSSAHATNIDSTAVLLRASPNKSAPIIAEVIASDKVILDAAPANQNASQGWRQLALPSPFKGHVATSAVGKNFAIVEGTPVYYLPTTDSATITVIEAGDLYQVVSTTDAWATIRLKKAVTGYFIDENQPAPEFDFDAVAVPEVSVRAVSEPIAIPAKQVQINPDDEIGTLDPNSLPPENVVWSPVVQTSPTPVVAAPTRHAPTVTAPRPQIEEPPAAVMVSRHNTQARERIVQEQVAKAPRLLSGRLVREIKTTGPYYPIRLRSPEGRLIAYVDFSKVYIDDLSPFIGKQVYVEGQIHPAPKMSHQLVIYAESLRIAE